MTETTEPTPDQQDNRPDDDAQPVLGAEATEIGDATKVDEAAEPDAGSADGEAAPAGDGPPEAESEDESEDESEGRSGGARGRRRASVSREDLETEGEIAADYLETLMDIADLDGDLEVDIERDRAAVSIVDSEDGPVSRRLVGPGAVVLDALQELTRLAVQAETGDRSRLMLDIAQYRADRKASLVALANTTATEVKDSGEARELDPMTAFERKVVHDAVLAAGLSSHSEGEEPNRYVVVTAG